MPTLSVCMIAKDEERLLPLSLHHIKPVADEIIVLIDTRTRDNTKAIAEAFDAKTSDFEWCNDFSKARNRSLELATKEWILILDADEIIEANHIKELFSALQKNPEIIGFSFVQKNYTDDETTIGFALLTEKEKKKIRKIHAFRGQSSCNIIRLFKNMKEHNKPLIFFQGAVHESVDDSIKKIKGVIAKTNIPIQHLQELKGIGFIEQKQLNYLEIYEKNIEKVPNKIKAYSDLGSLYFTYKNDFEKALSFFKKAQEIANKETNQATNTSKSKILLGLATCYFSLNMKKEAKKRLNDFIQQYPTHPNIKQAEEMIKKV